MAITTETHSIPTNEEEFETIMPSLQKLFKRNISQEQKDFEELYYHAPKTEKQLKDFEIIKTIGAGGFGRVHLVKHKSENEFYAMKTLQKSKIVKYRQIEHSKNEKKILLAIEFPFVVNMKYFFQDNSYLYFLMPFVAGGDMFTQLQIFKKFEEPKSRFYASQIFLALEYLHKCFLIFRDLKPENIMIDENGYLKLTDFGFCKHLLKERTWTMCGTPQYLAPEIIKQKGYGISVDWWALGILIYEMNAGHPPFDSSYHLIIYEKVLEGKFKCPPTFSKELRSLVQNLIQVDVTKRFGCMKNGSSDIKNDPWFNCMNWEEVLEKKVKAPFVPEVKSADDTRNFDKYETKPIIVSKVSEFDEMFKGF